MIEAEAGKPARRIEQIPYRGTTPLVDHRATLAELEALCGPGRIGAPVVGDSHRPDAYAMTVFAPSSGAGSLTRDGEAEAEPSRGSLAVRALGRIGAAGSGERLEAALGDPDPEVRAAAFGVAGPVVGGASRITNLDWTIRESDLARRLGTDRVRLLNDLAATARGLGMLRDDEMEILQAGSPTASGNGIRRCPNAVDRAKIPRPSPSGKRSLKVAPPEVDAAAGRPEVDAPVSAMLPGQGGPGPFTSEPARCDTSS